MRELTYQEVVAVNGAGIIADTITWLGAQAGDFIGNAIGSLTTVPILSTLISKATGFIGKQIGGWIGGSIGNLLEGLLGMGDDSTTA